MEKQKGSGLPGHQQNELKSNWSINDFFQFIREYHFALQQKKYYIQLALVSDYLNLLIRFSLEKLSLTRAFKFVSSANEIDDQCHIIEINIILENLSTKAKVLLIQMDRVIKVVIQNWSEKQQTFRNQEEFWFDHQLYLNPKISNSYKLSSLRELSPIYDKANKKSSQLNYLFVSRLFHSLALNLESLKLSEQYKTNPNVSVKVINPLDSLHFFNPHSNPQTAQKLFSVLAASQNLLRISSFLDLKSITRLTLVNRFMRKYFFTPQNLYFKTLYEYSFGRTGLEVNELDWKKALNKKRGQKSKSSKNLKSPENYHVGFVFRTH